MVSTAASAVVAPWSAARRARSCSAHSVGSRTRWANESAPSVPSSKAAIQRSIGRFGLADLGGERDSVVGGSGGCRGGVMDLLLGGFEERVSVGVQVDERFEDGRLERVGADVLRGTRLLAAAIAVPAGVVAVALVPAVGEDADVAVDRQAGRQPQTGAPEAPGVIDRRDAVELGALGRAPAAIAVRLLRKREGRSRRRDGTPVARRSVAGRRKAADKFSLPFEPPGRTY